MISNPIVLCILVACAALLAGHTNWEFDVTHSPIPDKHFSVLYRDAINPDFSVRDFTIQMSLVVQPAGAPVGSASWLALDLTRADTFIEAAKQKYIHADRTSFRFGWRWFFANERGDYTGRPENGQNPSVWYYGQIEPYSGLGNVCTLAGIPIRLAKLSNLLTSYTCEKLEVGELKESLMQLFGRRNGLSANLSRRCGRDIKGN